MASATVPRLVLGMVMLCGSASPGTAGQSSDAPQIRVPQLERRVHDLINAQRARAYLQDYFKKAAVETFAIFWGTAAEFLQELDRRLHAS